MSLLRKLCRLTRVLILILQLVLWLMGCGDAAEPAQQPRQMTEPARSAAPAPTVSEPDPAGVSPRPSIG